MEKQAQSLSRSSGPRIAVLIPAFNEEVVIEGTIQALLTAGTAKGDIYLVDDRSTDRTADIGRSCGINVYTVPENGGKARAQTEALRYFILLERYDWIIFLDGDSKVVPGCIDAFRRSAVERPDVSLFVGQIKSARNDHIFSASRAFDYTYGHDIAKQAQSNFNVIFVSPGCASMYRTDVLRELSIDPDTLAEDMDLTIQVHRKGGTVVYVPEAAVVTQDPSTFTDYHKQIMRWYRGFWQVVKKHNSFWWGPKNWVDAYMWMITADAILFNRVVWLAALFSIWPNIAWWAVAGDVGLSALIAGYSAYRTKRAEVLYKFPIYYWLSFLNLYAFTRAFVEIVVLRKQLLAWNKVKRYDFGSSPGLT